MPVKTTVTIFCFLFLFFSAAFRGEAQTKKKTTDKPPRSKSPQNDLKKLERETLAQIEKIKELNKPSNFYVFVGEKIEITPFEPKLEKGEILMDYSFRAKYRVRQNLYGNYDRETIEFEVYDHYGKPPFSRYENVLLFVSEYDGQLFHEKYQYFDVYKTKDGRWASCGDPYRFDEYHRKKFQPAMLEFTEKLSFETSGLNQNQVKRAYPRPFYAIEGNRAVCRMGAYIEDLFEVKKNGVLKARGLFK